MGDIISIIGVCTVAESVITLTYCRHVLLLVQKGQAQMPHLMKNNHKAPVKYRTYYRMKPTFRTEN